MFDKNNYSHKLCNNYSFVREKATTTKLLFNRQNYEIIIGLRNISGCCWSLIIVTVLHIEYSISTVIRNVMGIKFSRNLKLNTIIHAKMCSIYLSTNLYGSLWFGTNESSLLRWLFQPLQLWNPLLLLLKEDVFTSSFFGYLPFPWRRSSKCKSILSINKDENQRIVLLFYSIDFYQPRSGWV